MKLNKERRGVIYGLMTPDEKEIINRMYKVGKLHFFYNEKLNLKKTDDLTSNVAYWCPEWDELKGEALVGKWIRADDAFDRIIDYREYELRPYIGEFFNYCEEDNIEVISRAQFMKMAEDNERI